MGVRASVAVVEEGGGEVRGRRVRLEVWHDNEHLFGEQGHASIEVLLGVDVVTDACAVQRFLAHGAGGRLVAESLDMALPEEVREGVAHGLELLVADGAVYLLELAQMMAVGQVDGWLRKALIWLFPKKCARASHTDLNFLWQMVQSISSNSRR